MASRPLISVFDPETASSVTEKSIPLPAVFTAPIRQDIVSFVHSNIAKNRRQAHGVDPRQGHKHSAESWGTGRAVARIPRVSGSGTHRNGQGAFGNQCRKGRMFAPLKTWRRWHRRVNIKQRRHAVAAALAASALVPLVMARGHRISKIAELPLVFDDKLENYEKTKQAVEFLRRVGAYEDVEKVVDTKTLRAGKGKLRNRRWQTRKGPLIVYANENVKLLQAVRNIPGVEICNVNRLNLLQLAPGGQLGRFIIWTSTAFQSLNRIFGTYRYAAQEKDGYRLNRSILSNADLARIINSNEVQSVITPAKKSTPAHTRKVNPLNNKTALYKLNPNAKLVHATAVKANEDGRKRRTEALNAKRGISKSLTKEQRATSKTRKTESKKWINTFSKAISEANEVALAQEGEWRILDAPPKAAN